MGNEKIGFVIGDLVDSLQLWIFYKAFVRPGVDLTQVQCVYLEIPDIESDPPSKSTFEVRANRWVSQTHLSQFNWPNTHLSPNWDPLILEGASAG